MANPTTNYSFTMPTNTDLVKDLPADFEVFGQAVDTQMKTNADAVTTAIGTVIPKSIVDAKGDIIAATAADTVARLAVGTNGQVLMADSAETTGLKWGAAGGALTLSTIASGSLNSGTNLTLNSLSSYDTLDLIVEGVTFGGGASFTNFTLNNDNSSVYDYMMHSETYGNSNFYSTWTSGYTIIPISPNVPQANSNSANTYRLSLRNCKNSGFTTFEWQTIFYGYDYTWTIGKGIYKSAASISSIKFDANGQTFNGSGTYRLIGG